jgi:hypothetical protein
MLIISFFFLLFLLIRSIQQRHARVTSEAPEIRDLIDFPPFSQIVDGLTPLGGTLYRDHRGYAPLSLSQSLPTFFSLSGLRPSNFILAWEERIGTHTRSLLFPINTYFLSGFHTIIPCAARLKRRLG